MLERILDIGIGGGGSYINFDGKNTIRFGLDTQLAALRNLKVFYPLVKSTVGSAEHLPFLDSSFRRIDIVLPNRELAAPGLQIDHPKLGRECVESFKETHPNGWYAELSRVLSPGGALVLVGDLLHSSSIKSTSEKFFIVQSERKISLGEFKSLDTKQVRDLLEAYVYAYLGEDKDCFANSLLEIVLINKKAE